jgi:MFS family permease
MSVPARIPWMMIVAATLIGMITMGGRQVTGLFVAPLNMSTGLGLVTISFAMAIGQLTWGLAQPVFGALADRHGPSRVIAAGRVMIAAGMALTPFMSSEWSLIFSLGVLSAVGAGAGSLSILIGAASRAIPVERRTLAVSIISSGGSLGQFVFAPLTQVLINALGWVSAMLVLAVTALSTLPLAWPLRRREPAPATATGIAATATETTFGAQLRAAFGDASYLWLLLGFSTCGFHVAFLVTHMPGVVHMCGLPASVAATSIGLIGIANLVGTLGAGWLSMRYRLKSILFWIYLGRVVTLLWYVAAPKTEMTFYMFSIVLGLLWLANVPATAGLVGKLFGTRYLSTLFGIAMLSHQIGAFFGAWLGGYAVVRFGDYTWMFIADALLALLAAAVSLPVREARLVPAVAG